MKVYLTKTRWNVLRLLDAKDQTHPRVATVEMLQNELQLNQREAKNALLSMVQHKLMVRVMHEYRLTRVGVDLLVATRTKTINEVTFEIAD
jgi:RIO-like serine/threonine protein kinase